VEVIGLQGGRSIGLHALLLDCDVHLSLGVTALNAGMGGLNQNNLRLWVEFH